MQKREVWQAGWLCDEIRNRGWKVESVEVGVLGYIAASTRKELKRVGFCSKPLATALSEAALRCSYVIFIRHKTLLVSVEDDE